MASTTGQRRTLIEVQAPTQTADPTGQMQPSWSTVATLFGYVRPATGREVAVAGQQQSTLARVVETRWPGDVVTVTPLHRLVANGAVYSVTWVDNVGQRNKDLFIGCTERTEPAGD